MKLTLLAGFALLGCGGAHDVCAGGNSFSCAEDSSVADVDASTAADVAISDACLFCSDASFDVAPPPKPTGCDLATLGTTGPYPSDVFSNWLDQTTDAGVATLLDQVLTSQLLAPYKMIVVLDISLNHAYSPQEAAVLENWVKAGGGLMTVTGYHGLPEPTNVNRLLAPYTMSYDTNLVLNAGPAPDTWPINKWVPHALTTGITSIGFGNGFAVLGSGTMLASATDGTGSHNVLEAKAVGGGHVVLWGDEWITLDENWNAHPEYQMQHFWQNIVDWLNPQSGCQVPTPPK